MTYRDIISDIRSSFRMLSSDVQLNDRSILKEVMSVSNTIMGQAFARRKYFQSPNVFSFIPCLEMQEVPLSECCEYTSDINIAKSLKTLPKIGETIMGLSIQGVYGLDGRIKFRQSNPNRYSNLLKLKLPNRDNYFWILNNHLYVTNPETKLINMYAYFTEPISNDLLYPGKDCDCKVKPDIDSLCANPLDQRFPFPDERLVDLKSVVYKNLLSTYFNTKQDNTSDNKDDQSKP